MQRVMVIGLNFTKPCVILHFPQFYLLFLPISGWDCRPVALIIAIYSWDSCPLFPGLFHRSDHQRQHQLFPHVQADVPSSPCHDGHQSCSSSWPGGLCSTVCWALSKCFTAHVSYLQSHILSHAPTHTLIRLPPQDLSNDEIWMFRHCILRLYTLSMPAFICCLMEFLLLTSNLSFYDLVYLTLL